MIKRYIKRVGNPTTGGNLVYIVFDGAPIPLKSDTYAAWRKTPKARAEIERHEARAPDDAGWFAASTKKWRELCCSIRAAL